MSVSGSKNAGFTMIEVLIAVLLLAIGVLGIAATQMISFQTNQSAYARSQAIYLATDIFDRIRANPEGYQSTSVYDSVDSLASEDVPSDPNCIDSNGGCTPVQMARYDVREWIGNFSNVDSIDDYQPMLPNGRGVLARIGTSNDFVATVSWDERDWEGDNRVVRTRQVSITARVN